MMIIVDISRQRLYLKKGKRILKSYPVSTSRYGVGNRDGSFKTPLGRHIVVSKIGRNARFGEILRNRRRTGKIARIGRDSAGDLITTRILRLKGTEPGVNAGKGIDTFQRCIYIHGTAEEHKIGRTASHGCIRMKNKDIIELFRIIKRGTLVDIRA